MKSGSIFGAAVALLVCSTVPGRADPPSAPAASGPAAAAPEPAAPSSSSKADAKPDVSTLLFGTPMWDRAPVGSKLTYTFDKTTSEAALGKPFKDQVLLTLYHGDNAKTREVEMRLFTGENRKPAGPFRSDEQNPIMLVVLENNVQELSTLFKANPRYLKNAIRKAWRNDATIEPAQDEVDGKSVAVTRISVQPFLHDDESDRMLGLQALRYVVDVSPDVPGYIAAVDIRATAKERTLFSETLRYESETKP